jgi:alanine racemase
LNAISYNLNFFKSKLKPNVKIMVMVKAFGYGMEAGDCNYLNTVDYLGVAADEGITKERRYSIANYGS